MTAKMNRRVKMNKLRVNNNNAKNCTNNFNIIFVKIDRLCGLVVRVLGYRSGGPGSIPGTTRKKK
jgi:hypothetical protein